MQVICPHCQKLLICKACGFVYGQEEGEDTSQS
jgi:rubredoxin